jgi:hypothetical protein
MSADDVFHDDMDTLETLEADPDLAGFLAEMRSSFSASPPVVGDTLARLLSQGLTAPAPTPLAPGRVRRRVVQLAAAAAAALFVTGGLAVAGALPGRAQDVLAEVASRVGIDLPASNGLGRSDTGHDAPDRVPPGRPTSTTSDTIEDGAPSAGPGSRPVPGAAPSAPHPDNHGGDVSDVATDDSTQGCEHGRAVSEVASGRANDKPCPSSPTTTAAPPTSGVPAPTTAAAPGKSGDAPGREHAADPSAVGNGNGNANKGSTPDSNAQGNGGNPDNG